jgi:hypothetical protein
VRTVLVTVLVGVGALAACGSDDGSEPQTFCPADALLGPNGESFGRDPAQDCRFVDDDGKPITTTRGGEPICYESGAVVVPCE